MPQADVPAAHHRIASAVRSHIGDDTSGHGLDHAWRVYRLGRRLATEEGADFDVVGAAALVHDIHRVRGDGFVHPRETLPAVRQMLGDAAYPAENHEAVCHCVAYHEEYDFADTTDLDHVPTVEERVLRDADNLDALGAIGLARAITFGAHHGQQLYDPDHEPADSYDRTNRNNTVIQHVEEKLLRLPEVMETPTGRQLATERAAFVQQFIDRFTDEWQGER